MSLPGQTTRKALLEAARRPRNKRASDGMRVLKDYYGAVEPLGPRSFRFVLSTGSVDRAGDVVNPAGWVLNNYLRNPVVLLEHGFHPVLGTLSIGRSESVVVAGGQLKAVVVLDAPETPITGPYAEMVRMKLEAKSLFACSVGFRPIDFDVADDRGDVLDAKFDFKRNELTEWSIVSVPCNPEALAETEPSAMDGIREAVMAGKSFRFRTPPGSAARKLEIARMLG